MNRELTKRTKSSQCGPSGGSAKLYSLYVYAALCRSRLKTSRCLPLCSSLVMVHALGSKSGVDSGTQTAPFEALNGSTSLYFIVNPLAVFISRSSVIFSRTGVLDGLKPRLLSSPT
uniref:Uncharacterized protein n=1 Tax=Meloidogyne incognita TaxID=6306 RepID=A0A914P2N7_MELIC